MLQGLSARGRLEQFDYLSTVSGGGYIGSWLSRWGADHSSLDAALKETPNVGLLPGVPTASAGQQRPPVRRLRSFSNYLSPSWGLSIDALTVVTIFLRNLLLNLLVWIPLLLLLASIPRIAMKLIAVATQGWVVMGLPVTTDDRILAIFGIPAIAAIIWLIVALLISGLWGRWMGEERREKLSRIAAFPMLVAFGWLALSALFYILPDFGLRHIAPLKNRLGIDENELAIGGGLFATLTSLAGYWSRYGPDLRKKAYGVANALGARMLDLAAALALLLMTMGAGVAVEHGVRYIAERSMDDPQKKQNPAEVLGSNPLPDLTAGFLPADFPMSGQLLLWAVMALAATVLVASWLVGANRFSLHGLYGNRLVRAYLGSARLVRNPSRFTDFDSEDNVDIAALRGGPYGPGGILRPFHVVNMTLNLTRSSQDRRDWQERKGASFTATPLHSGSSVTGYAASNDMGMTLARAMTISGAAATPNMGYNSSPLVTLLMTFFNVRLGWWVPHPDWMARRQGKYRSTIVRWLVDGSGAAAGKPLSEPRSGLLHILREAFFGTSAESRWLYLSDGGHFDNLGLYEMVRRRCQRIVVVDAGCDGEFKHGDLHNAVRKIKVDLAVTIDFLTDLPGQPGPGQRQRVTIAKIRYSAIDRNVPDGDLIILKPILIGGEPPALADYAETSRKGGKTFPHHSTADQFFTETQFESYRALGEWSVEDLVAAIDGKAGLAPPGPPAATDPPPAPSLTGTEGLAATVKALSPGQMIAGLVATAGAVGAVAGIGQTLIVRNFGPETGPGREVVGTMTIDPPLPNPLPTTLDAEGRVLVEELIKALGGVKSQGTGPDGALVAKIEEIRLLLEDWKRHQPLPTPNSPVRVSLDQRQVTMLVNSNTSFKAAIIEALKSLQGNTANGKASDLREVVEQLKVIASRIEATGPRRNVRGG